MSKPLRWLALMLGAWFTFFLGCTGSQSDQPSHERNSIAEAHYQGKSHLIKISKGDFTAHLLPALHIGFKIEFDANQKDVIHSVAEQSSTLISERAFFDFKPNSPYHGRTCLESNSGIDLLSRDLARRIVNNHPHSHWSSLYKVYREIDPNNADKRFEGFILARGAMINFWELYLFIYGSIQEEVESKLPINDPRRVPEDAFSRAPARMIASAHPHLETESIESMSDLVDAVCRLDADEQVQAITDMLRAFDRAREDVHARQPHDAQQLIELMVTLMRVQMGWADPPTAQAIGRHVRLTPEGRLQPGNGGLIDRMLSDGKALDKMMLGHRNTQWAERIEDDARRKRKGLFYVLGAAHFVDFEHFDGLPRLLKARGFEITVVEQPDLPPQSSRTSLTAGSPP